MHTWHLKDCNFISVIYNSSMCEKFHHLLMKNNYEKEYIKYLLSPTSSYIKDFVKSN